MITFSKELLTKLRASLLTAFKLKNIQAYRLATALICYGEGRGIKDIAILFGINCKTVGHWLLKFMSGGIDWVMGKHYHGRGRKEKLTKAQKKQLCVMVTEGPEAHGFSSGIWNCAMIAGNHSHPTPTNRQLMHRKSRSSAGNHLCQVTPR